MRDTVTLRRKIVTALISSESLFDLQVAREMFLQSESLYAKAEYPTTKDLVARPDVATMWPPSASHNKV